MSTENGPTPERPDSPPPAGGPSAPAGGGQPPEHTQGAPHAAGPQWGAPAGPGGPSPYSPWGAPPPAAGGGAGAGGGWGSAPGGPTPGSDSGSGSGKKGAGGLVAAVLAAALLAGGVGGGIGYWAAEHNDDDSSSTTISAPDGGSQRIENPPGSVAAIANRALTSVVTIEARGASDGDGGTGTGFVYDKEGHILTNNHVVASAANGGKLSATFSDGKTYDAEVVGRAQGYDVAVIKLTNASGAKLTPLPLGDSTAVDVGDMAIAIGAPFGLSGTVTTGIVSAKNRPVASGDGQSDKNSYMSAIQTDASINPGNSGGPLLDTQGRVIGVNSAIQTTSQGEFGGQGGSIGLGFAIPINQAHWVADTLIKDGEPVYAVIGVQVDMSYQGQGARVSESSSGSTPAVTPGGPAAKAGIKPGDVITKVDNTVIDSGPTLIGQLWTHKPGDKVKVTYERDGKEQTTTMVTLGEFKGDR
ncbi:S1C family serine protease [Streptomyces polyrhachis]|uniref:S1C family serine protease n=1 Tax=Streptomyces polyrhachis TaxID=1282885 RepID=A0ABW2GB08_9ACTN